MPWKRGEKVSKDKKDKKCSDCGHGKCKCDKKNVRIADLVNVNVHLNRNKR